MNKRIVWNFEINESCSLSRLKPTEKDSLKWEKRFFWPEKSIIKLETFEKTLLHFENCKIKNRIDTYYFITDGLYNIKKRNESLYYKPCVDKKNGCHGFDKKINLSTSHPELILPFPDCTVKDLLFKIEQENQSLNVEKTAFVYKLSTDPTIKIELARICLHDKIFFSTCIEGYSFKLVNQVAENLLKDKNSCDYVSFLKEHQK